jgi:hypothetical protein
MTLGPALVVPHAQSLDGHLVSASEKTSAADHYRGKLTEDSLAEALGERALDTLITLDLAESGLRVFELEHAARFTVGGRVVGRVYCAQRTAVL